MTWNGIFWTAYFAVVIGVALYILWMERKQIQDDDDDLQTLMNRWEHERTKQHAEDIAEFNSLLPYLQAIELDHANRVAACEWLRTECNTFEDGQPVITYFQQQP